MWRFKSFMPKESAGLEGRTIDVGNVKVQVRNTIAEGGFSCVYVARDVVSSKQYALKHMICNDGESLDLVMKEISVMKLLKGHPNIVTLVAHSIADTGRTKEAFLVMEFCDKSLVAVLDKREAGYFDEKQVLLIFRDVCNAVFAMHCQSPPIAHRDLKAENVLLGADGAWKLCDFGSTSTNHKCFDKPEEMGVEEDNIRKHTTPAYRAPEMWDLFRREVISEKVDIWALGCLLYRICYLKLAFDGESKLQILNGNYRIPELPKYSPAVMGLIKDMLEGSPGARPDITQVWFRVNEQLPVELQKHLPEGTASAVDTRHPTPVLHDEGVSKRGPPMPHKSPPPPPSATEQVWNILPQSEKDGQRLKSSQATSKPGPIGAFWSTQHARDTIVEDKGPLFEEEPTNQMKSKHNQKNLDKRSSPQRELHSRPGEVPKNVHINSPNEPTSGDFEISFFPEDSQHSSDKNKAQHSEDKASFQNKAFNTFMAEFDSSNLKSRTIASNALNNRSGKEELEAEVEKLKEQLRQANLEKAEITSKYEKLSAICRSQRQEIHELKRALSAATPPPPIKEHSKNEMSPGNSHSSTPPREKIEGTVWELRQGMIGSGSASLRPDPKSWQMFTESSKAQPTATNNYPKLVRTTNSHNNTTMQSTMGIVNENIWGFEDSFTAAPASSQISSSPAGGSTSSRFFGSGTKKIETSQPAGWAGF